jgi:hypothetical protein
MAEEMWLRAPGPPPAGGALIRSALHELDLASNEICALLNIGACASVGAMKELAAAILSSVRQQSSAAGRFRAFHAGTAISRRQLRLRL